MQEKLKVITIGDYQSSILENHFKDNKNIEFLELALNENIEKLDNKLSNRVIRNRKSFKRKGNYYSNYFRRKTCYRK